jgi:hypothetical protein
VLMAAVLITKSLGSRNGGRTAFGRLRCRPVVMLTLQA